jgi:hypothetical protein
MNQGSTQFVALRILCWSAGLKISILFSSGKIFYFFANEKSHCGSLGMKRIEG